MIVLKKDQKVLKKVLNIFDKNISVEGHSKTGAKSFSEQGDELEVWM